MELTRKQLRRIIKEELEGAVNEAPGPNSDPRDMMSWLDVTICRPVYAQSCTYLGIDDLRWQFPEAWRGHIAGEKRDLARRECDFRYQRGRVSLPSGTELIG